MFLLLLLILKTEEVKMDFQRKGMPPPPMGVLNQTKLAIMVVLVFVGVLVIGGVCLLPACCRRRKQKEGTASSGPCSGADRFQR